MRKLGLICMALLLGMVSNAQVVQTQIVRGTIISSDGEAVIGATIIVKGTDPLIGATSDDEGKFRMEVPLGRQSLEVRSIGYSPRVEEVLVSSGRETVMEIRLEQISYTLEGVEIVRHYNKARPLQPLTYAGARSFSVEDTERYAGSLQDPSRMVRSFAGVMPINDSRNEIVVRGNSPLGVQSRLDGIEVPNPNHFNAGLGMTAGQVTALNMNLISNSDFLMGGWPATQGNALAGIFDLNLRNGNEDRHEMRFQMGYNGIEAMVEGPITKDSKLTYIASYRYSIPDLMTRISKKFSEFIPVSPKYQDFTAKLKYQFNDRHALSLIGLVGNSSIYMQTSELIGTQSIVEADLPEGYDEKVDLKSIIAMTGLVYEGNLNDRTQLKGTLSWNYNKIDMLVDTLNTNESNKWMKIFYDQSQEHKLSLTADVRYRVLQNANIFAGIIADHYIIKSYNEVGDLPYPLNDSEDNLRLLRLYAQYQHIFSPSFTATVGAHSMYLPYNGSFVVEPRAGLEYKLGQSHTLGLSGGMYSQLPPRTFFFVQTPTEAGVLYTNKDLGFSKSWNVNLAYNFQINKDWRIRTEVYYQSHFEIPAEEKAYGMSLLNYGAGENYVNRVENLKNIGKGRNYGVELTVEKFYSDRYFLLLSTTLYRSLYTDPVLEKEFSTVFDGGYIANLSGGVEWPINPKWMLFLSPRLAVAGGLKYTPVLEQQSVAAGVVILDQSQWYSEQYPTYFRADARFGFRINGKRTSQEFGFDLINITNHKNIASKNYDPKRGKYVDVSQFGFLPMVTYRLNFNISK